MLLDVMKPGLVIFKEKVGSVISSAPVTALMIEMTSANHTYITHKNPVMMPRLPAYPNMANRDPKR